MKAAHRGIETVPNNNDSLFLGFSADIKTDVMKIRSHTLGILLLRSQESFTDIRHYDGVFRHLPELADYKKAEDRLQSLQTKFEWTKKGRGVGKRDVSLGPVHTFLQTEWENLAEIVSSLFEKAHQPSQDRSASQTLSFISELETRANLLHMYELEEYSRSAPVYCLSAFTNPRGFLAAVIREAVLNTQSEISCIELHFQVYFQLLLSDSIKQD